MEIARTLFRAAQQVWYLGMVHTSFSVLLNESLVIPIELLTCLSTTLYLYSICWLLLFYRQSNVLLMIISVLGMFVSFLSILKLISHVGSGRYPIYLVCFLVFSTFSVTWSFFHMSSNFYAILSQMACFIFVLSPSWGYLMGMLVPLEYNVCALGFCFFWAVLSYLSFDHSWWAKALSAVALIGCVRQLLSFYRVGRVSLRNSSVENSGVEDSRAQRSSGVIQNRFGQQESVFESSTSGLTSTMLVETPTRFHGIGDDEAHSLILSPVIHNSHVSQANHPPVPELTEDVSSSLHNTGWNINTRFLTLKLAQEHLDQRVNIIHSYGALQESDTDIVI